MPVQDLTPQLRTRLSRVERAVGWFVILATLLLLAGFAYYVYHTAQRKGWFLIKLKYHTFVQSGAGLHVGDPVLLMGFDAGEITEITPMPPFSAYGNVYVEFLVREPYYGYIWTDSYVKLASAGLLGNRVLEVIQGGTTGATNLQPSYLIEKDKVLGVWDPSSKKHVPYTPKSKGYGFNPTEPAPVVTEQVEQLLTQVKGALPGILNLTNDLAQVLSNVVQVTSHADNVILQTQPLLTNLALISTLITNGQGSLGDWLIPTNLNVQLQQTLSTANATLFAANTNLGTLATSLNLTLENLANITSNLNTQVQTNDQILGQVSAAVVHADDLVQGLKRHWLLRSAFKNSEPKSPEPARPGRQLPRSSPPPAPKTGHRIP
ncbi:MAG: MlaD family protein [Verrucomicrobiota bacterium]